MPFTAPSVANKGNRFRIGPRTDILVAVRELVVFNILQDTLMLIPTLGLQPVRPYPDRQFKNSSGSPVGDNCSQPPILPGLDRQSFREGESPCYVELIAATRVLDSTCRTDETLLVWPFIPPGPTAGVPVKVRACRIKNLASWSRLLPLSAGGQALALAYYTYEVEIVYADGAGRTATLAMVSGLRHQQAVVYPGSGYLEVDVRVSCLGSNVVTSPVIPRTQLQSPPAYKPARVWFRIERLEPCK